MQVSVRGMFWVVWLQHIRFKQNTVESLWYWTDRSDEYSPISNRMGSLRLKFFEKETTCLLAFLDKQNVFALVLLVHITPWNKHALCKGVYGSKPVIFVSKSNYCCYLKLRRLIWFRILISQPNFIIKGLR